MTQTDIVQTETGDIDLSAGDLRYGESTAQHQRDILIAGQGDFKESPTVGVGSARYLNDNLPDDYLRQVRKQMQQDGMTVQRIAYGADGELTIKAEYNDGQDY